MLKSLYTLWPYVVKYRRGLALGIGALFIKDLLAVALPLIIRYGVDSLTHAFQIRILLNFAGLLVAVSLIKGVFQYWMRVIIIGISRDIDTMSGTICSPTLWNCRRTSIHVFARETSWPEAQTI